MAGLTYPLVIWKDYHAYALVAPGTQRVAWEDVLSWEQAQERVRWVQRLELERRLVRVSNYPFEEGGQLWTVVVDWF